jgi:hypothetical protein
VSCCLNERTDYRGECWSQLSAHGIEVRAHGLVLLRDDMQELRRRCAATS